MPAEPTPSSPSNLLSIVIILLTFAFPVAGLIAAMWFMPSANRSSPTYTSTGTSSLLTPSKLLADKGRYSQQKLTVNGRTYLEPVTCQKKDCPPNDSCCGCPSERHLALSDAGTLISTQTKQKLRLLTSSGKALCQRQPFSCQYDCPGWDPGNIYNVTGTFYSEVPPPGWKLSLDFYFLVESQQLAQKVTTSGTIHTIIEDIKRQFRDLTESTTYILP